MSRLSRRIREREAAINADRRNMAAAVTTLRASMRHRMSRSSTFCAAFGGGLLLGWVSGGSKAPRAAPAVEPNQAAARRTPLWATRLVREALWPWGVSVMRAQLERLLTANAQRR